MAIRKLLGKRIREYRLTLGLTQQELAEMADVESPSYISKIESGEASPSYDLLEKLAGSLNVPVQDLFTSEASKNLKKDPLDKWILKIRAVLKGNSDKDIKTAFNIFQKLLSKK